jgi:uncharacterized protein YegL
MESKGLRPRSSAQQDIDVIILVDGSESVISTDFNKEKQLCLELAARLSGNSQLGVIQFGSKAQIVTPLTTNREELETKVDVMTKISGSSNLSVAFEICYSEFNRSKAINNQRQVWIFTNGNFKQDPRNATLTEKLIREQQVTVIAIGIGHRVDMRLLNRLAASGCCFLVGDYSKALKLFQYNPNKERNCQVSANIIFPNSVPGRLGESIILRVEVENVGLKDIPQGTKVIFRENTYFREVTVVLYETLHVGYQTSFYVTLPIKAYDLALDAYLAFLPELIEFTIVDSANKDITCDCTGFFLNLEDFAGDVLTYKPPQDLELVNIMTFGPPGVGKSLFVNSMCSTLSDHIHNLAIVAGQKKAGGKTLQKFQLNEIPGFEQTPIVLFDLPGVEETNFQGEELNQYLDGLVNNKQTVVYQTVKGIKFTPHEALAQRMHVVAFFVHPSLDEATMELLVTYYTKITTDKKSKVIIIISHSDTVLETDRRAQMHNDVCKRFSIDPSNVFFLENYVDVKDKQFNIDRNVLRILLALIDKADEFVAIQRPGSSEEADVPEVANPVIIIDPESLPRDEREALMLENNEMHVHINKLQAQINNLTNYKAALESMLTEEQKMALRGEVPQRSLVRQVTGLVTSPFSFFRSVLFGQPAPLPIDPSMSPRPRSGSLSGSPQLRKRSNSSAPNPNLTSQNPLKSSATAVSPDSQTSAPPASPSSAPPSPPSPPSPQSQSQSSAPSPPTGPRYGAPRVPKAPKGDGSLFSLTNKGPPKAAAKLKFNVRTKDKVSSPVETPQSPTPESPAGPPNSPDPAEATTTTTQSTEPGQSEPQCTVQSDAQVQVPVPVPVPVQVPVPVPVSNEVQIQDPIHASEPGQVLE